jgi:surfeit locus 1 family protein
MAAAFSHPTLSTSPSRRPSPHRGLWLWTTLAVILLSLLFLRLGFWQLERRAARRSANTLLLERLEQPPIALDGRPLDPDQADLRRAVVRGTYDYDQEIVLRNRTLNELPGVHAITPLRITGSAGGAILVDRGWVPYEMASPEQRATLDRPDGEIEVRGIIHRSQVRPSNLAPADLPLGSARSRLDAWHRVDVARIQEQVPYPLLPVFLEEEVPPSTLQTEAAQRFPRPVPEIELGEGSHLFYALQWFAFALILLAGYALLYYRRFDNRSRGG